MKRRYLIFGRSTPVTPPANNEVDVFIMYGQSNEASRGTVGTATGTYPVINPNIQIYYKTTETTTDDGIWMDYNAPSKNNYLPSEQSRAACICMAAAFGYLYHQTYGKKAYFIKIASGGKSIYPSSNMDLSANSNSEYWDILIATIQQACNKLIDQGLTPRIRLFDFHQGEADALATYSAAAYYNQFKQIKLELRGLTWTYNNVVMNLANTPIIINRIHADIVGYPQKATVRTKQDRSGRYIYNQGVVTDQGNIINPEGDVYDDLTYINSIDHLTLLSDGVHIDAPSQESKGVADFDIWNNYLRVA